MSPVRPADLASKAPSVCSPANCSHKAYVFYSFVIAPTNN